MFALWTPIHALGALFVMAKPGDWHTKPLPEKHVVIEYGREFSKVFNLNALYNNYMHKVVCVMLILGCKQNRTFWSTLISLC